MKTQTYGLGDNGYIGPQLLLAARDSKGCAAYRSKRENGAQHDEPNWSFPMDGKVEWIPQARLGIYQAKYREGPKDRAWMEEKDRNYVLRLEREGALDTTEPNLKTECPKSF